MLKVGPRAARAGGEAVACKVVSYCLGEKFRILKRVINAPMVKYILNNPF